MFIDDLKLYTSSEANLNSYKTCDAAHGVLLEPKEMQCHKCQGKVTCA